MKIAIVNQPISEVFLPEGRGSIGIVTVELARRLAKSNEVVAYIRGHGIRKKEIWDKGVNYRFIPVGFDEKFFLKILSGFSTLFPMFFDKKRPEFTSWFYYISYILQISIDIRMQKFDIVHIHSFTQFVPIIRALNPDIKIVLHVHNNWMSDLDSETIERHLINTDLVVCVSDYIAEKFRSRFPKCANRCQTVYNGVDINLFSRKNDPTANKKDDTRRLLFVGRVTPEKGVHILIESFSKISKIYPNVKLEIVGPLWLAPMDFNITISDDDKVRELAHYYDKNSQLSYFTKLKDLIPKNLENNVIFTDQLPQSQIVNHYLDTDVFILPSICHEGFGMTIIEAMACQVSVVVSRSGGATEIVEGCKCGLIVERGDSNALAEAIIQLLSDDKLRKNMGIAGRERVLELFSWDRISENLLNEYHKLLI
ncbi:MAG: glycosyltransferase family 4 protein [Candidatus Methanoperedens sp.]|nr:glycosyltransferase family 4 protein [Candidatus Methanoperedens sp.]